MTLIWRTGLCFLLSNLLFANLAHVEGGPPSFCAELTLGRFYAGTGECADIKYAVFWITPIDSNASGFCEPTANLLTADHCGVRNWTDLPTDTSDAGPSWVIVGTSAVAQMFDVDVVDDRLAFDAFGGTFVTHSEEVSYGIVPEPADTHLGDTVPGLGWAKIALQDWEQTVALVPAGNGAIRDCIAESLRGPDAGAFETPIPPDIDASVPLCPDPPEVVPTLPLPGSSSGGTGATPTSTLDGGPSSANPSNGSISDAGPNDNTPQLVSASAQPESGDCACRLGKQVQHPSWPLLLLSPMVAALLWLRRRSRSHIAA
jgi:hypothetical protein